MDPQVSLLTALLRSLNLTGNVNVQNEAVSNSESHAASSSQTELEPDPPTDPTAPVGVDTSSWRWYTVWQSVAAVGPVVGVCGGPHPDTWRELEPHRHHN